MKKENYQTPAIKVVEIKKGPLLLAESGPTPGGGGGSRAQRFQGAFSTEED